MWGCMLIAHFNRIESIDFEHDFENRQKGQIDWESTHAISHSISQPLNNGK